MRGYFLDHSAMYAQIPDMACKSHLPRAGFEPRAMRVHDNGLRLLVSCWPAQVRKGGAAPHRLRAWCACGRFVSTGRLGQHAKACAPLREKLALVRRHLAAKETAPCAPLS
jgi:hypothetical protein